MSEVGSVYTLDISAALAGLDRLAAREVALRGKMIEGERAHAASFQETARQALNYQRLLQQHSEEIRNGNLLYKEQREQLRALVQNSREMERAIRAAGGASTEAGRKLATELKRNQAEQKELNREIGLTRQAIDEERAAQSRLRQEQQGSVAQQKLATAAAKDATAAERERAKAAAAAKDQSVTKAPSSGGGLFGSLTGGGGLLAGLAGRIIPVVAGLQLLDKAIDKVKEGINKRAEQAGLISTFQALTGSAAAGAKEFTYVKQQADSLGLTLAPLAKAYTGIYAAAKDANLPLADTRAIFQGVTAEAKALGKSDEDVERALKAVQQMLSKGRVSAEELRGQLGDVLPDAVGKAAKALGVNTAELDKMLQKGQIVAKDFLPKFAAELQKAYGQGSADAATKLRSNLSRINTFIDEQAARVGALVEPVIKSIADLVGAPARLSQSIQQELVDLETSAQKIRETNIGSRERVELIRQLQQEYPGYLGNLNAETATNEQLSAAIDKVSESLVNRIVIQRKEEEIGEQAQKTADKRIAALEAERNLREKLINIQKQNESQRRRNSTFVDETGDRRPVRSLRDELSGLDLAAQAELATDAIAKGEAGISRQNAAYGSLVVALKEYRQAQIELAAEDLRGNDLAAEKRRLLRELGIEESRAAAGTAGNAKAQQGYIEQLRESIKVTTELRDKINNAPQTADNPTGGGQQRRDRLNAQIKEYERLLALAEGKEEKGAKQRENALQAALKQLIAAREKLRAEGRRVELERLREDGKALAAEQLRQDLLAIGKLEETIKAKEAAVKKKGGKGADADGTLSVAEQEEINKLTADAKRRFDESLEQIERETNARLLNLQKDSDAKELAQLEAKFAEEIRIARRANNQKLVEGLEAARQEQVAALRQAQTLRRIDYEERLKLEGDRRNTTPLQDSLPDVTADQSDNPAIRALKQENFFRRLLANAAVDIERDKQKRILQDQIAFNNQRLDALKDDFSDEGIERRIAIQGAIQDQTDALNKLNKQRGFDLLRLLGVKEEDRSEVQTALNQAVSQSLAAINQILSAEVQAAQAKIDARTRQIDELQRDLDREYQYNKEGSASNIATKKKEIEDLKAQRREAMEDQRKAAKQQQLIQDLTAVSSISLAVANVIAGWSQIPLVGSILGIVAAGAMVASFIATKAKAKDAAKSNAQGYFKGGFTGGASIYEERGPTHGREFVFDHQKTEQYRAPLFEALHRGRPQDIDWNNPHMRQLLPDYSLPSQLHAERAAAVEHRLQHSFAPLQAGLDGLQREMMEMKQHVSRLPRVQYVNNPNGTLTCIDLENGNKVTYRQE